jgi:lysophospholipase L1-like esterase
VNPQPHLITRHTRWIALLLSTVVGIFAVEFGLRQVYATLPSIAALQGSDFRLERLVDLAEDPDLSLCHEVRTFLSHRSRWISPGAASGVHFAALEHVSMDGDGAVRFVGSRGGNTARRVWIAGDSLAYGLGVRPEESFGVRLAGQVTLQTGGQVELRNLSVPGAGYCTVVQRVATALKTHPPDVVLLVLSADDLEERLMLQVNGKLVAPPDLASGRLTRWMVNRSWFANLLWFRVSALSELSQGERRRFVGSATKDSFRSAVSGLNERIAAGGGRLVVAIVEPPGMPLCRGALAQDRCGWLKDDMATMAGLLSEAGIEHSTIAGIWSGRLDDIVPREHALARQGVLAMHPSAAGHQTIADAIWPVLKSAL